MREEREGNRERGERGLELLGERQFELALVQREPALQVPADAETFALLDGTTHELLQRGDVDRREWTSLVAVHRDRERLGKVRECAENALRGGRALQLVSEDVDLGRRHRQLERDLDRALVDLEDQRRARPEARAPQRHRVGLRSRQRTRLDVDARASETRDERGDPIARAADELRPTRGVEIPRRDDEWLRRRAGHDERRTLFVRARGRKPPVAFGMRYSPALMRFHAGEIGGLVLGALIVAVAVVGAAGLLRSRSRMKRDRDALGDALAASEAVSAALSEEALFLSAVLSAVDAAIVLFDRAGRVRFVNERFEDLFGVRDDAVVGRSRDHFVQEIVICFRDPEVFRSVAFGDDDERTSGQRTTRHSGIAAPDEIELVLERPARKVVLFSVVPVLQGDRRIGVLAMFRDVTAQRAAEDARERLLAELAARATTDALTNLKNRRAASEALTAEVERARRYERPLAIALFDIDNFKRINDDFGHEVGDHVLRAFARVLETTARTTDLVGRWGGEEFLAIVHEADLEAAARFAERVRAGLAEANPLAEILEERPAAVRPVTCSAGVTVLHADDDADAFVRRADAALYDAKHEGRDRVRGRP